MADYPTPIDDYVLDQVFGYQDANYSLHRTDSLMDAILKEHRFSTVDSNASEHGEHQANFLTNTMIQADAVTKSKIKIKYVDVVCSSVTGSGDGTVIAVPANVVPNGIINIEVDSNVTANGFPLGVTQVQNGTDISIYLAWYKTSGSGTLYSFTIRCYYFDD